MGKSECIILIRMGKYFEYILNTTLIEGMILYVILGAIPTRSFVCDNDGVKFKYFCLNTTCWLHLNNLSFVSTKRMHSLPYPFVELNKSILIIFNTLQLTITFIVLKAD